MGKGLKDKCDEDHRVMEVRDINLMRSDKTTTRQHKGVVVQKPTEVLAIHNTHFNGLFCCPL
jgi:hypothetical protein